MTRGGPMSSTPTVTTADVPDFADVYATHLAPVWR
jgi:hypothetical protein